MTKHSIVPTVLAAVVAVSAQSTQTSVSSAASPASSTTPYTETPSQTPPAATYTIPPDVQNSLNKSAEVTIVNDGDDTKPTLEWTALGDSYAAGVGTTEYVDGLRCLRYDEAYPLLMNLNPEYAPGGDQVFPPGPHKLNNVVCSGAETKDILDWQLLDEPTYWQPNPTFGNRPAFGSPEFATLTAGGDDIDFPGILFNCILGVHIKGGPTKRTCTDQRQFTWSLLNDGGYINDLGTVIDAIMKKGRTGPKGDEFRLYLTGYGRFFNADTTGSDTNCDETTFQIDGLWSAKPLGPNGAADAKLTKEIRQDFNNMADSLNEGIQRAVNNYNDDHVKFVDIQIDPAGQDILSGHRFCEKNVQEPDGSNTNLYFWHYPYATSANTGATNSSTNSTSTNSTSTDPFETVFNEAYQKTWDDAQPDVNAKYPKFTQFWSAVLDNLTPSMFSDHGIPDWNDPHIWGGSLGYRTRVFHPQFNWHKSITTSVLAQYLIDHTASTSNTTNTTTTSSSSSQTTSTSSSSSSTSSTSATPTPDSAILASFTSSCDDANVCTGTQLVVSFPPGQTPPKPCGAKTVWDKGIIDFKANGDPSDPNFSMGPFDLNEWKNCVYTTVYADDPTQWGSLKCDGMANPVSCGKVDQPDCTGWGSYTDLGVCAWPGGS